MLFCCTLSFVSLASCILAMWVNSWNSACQLLQHCILANLAIVYGLLVLEGFLLVQAYCKCIVQVRFWIATTNHTEQFTHKRGIPSLRYHNGGLCCVLYRIRAWAPSARNTDWSLWKALQCIPKVSLGASGRCVSFEFRQLEELGVRTWST